MHFVGLPYAGYADGRWDTLPPRTERWLREDLQAAAGERTVLLAHYPGLGRLLEQYHIDLGLFGDSHTEGPYVRVGSEQPEFGPKALVGGMCQAARDPKTGARRYDATGCPMGYRIVVVDKDGIDTFFKALGEPHTIMVTQPRRFQAARTADGARLVGQFFDPAGEATDVRVSVAGMPHEVTVSRGPLWGRFEAPLGHAGLPDGFHDVRVTVRYADGDYSVTEPYLILTGMPGNFGGDAFCKLTGAIDRLPGEQWYLLQDGRVQTDAWAVLDGQASVVLRTGLGGRLVTIGLKSTEAGKPVMHDVHLTGDDGRVYYDQHRVFRWGFGSDLQPGRQVDFDLLYPGPPVWWKVVGPAE